MGWSLLQAYILVNTEPGRLWKVKEEALKIPGVKMAHAVTGQFDVIAYVEFVDIDELGRIIDRLQSISGVLKTHTAISMADRLTEEI
ncbi:MAG: AsnC family transcriptional regulator [Candidatus Bathyarchaeota archaeon B26-2]|nr:MAG: AsnC family transcriptional regulator [Candidatus Bathyarchaeota archaeon B26-2]